MTTFELTLLGRSQRSGVRMGPFTVDAGETSAETVLIALADPDRLNQQAPNRADDELVAGLKLVERCFAARSFALEGWMPDPETWPQTREWIDELGAEFVNRIDPESSDKEIAEAARMAMDHYYNN